MSRREAGDFVGGIACLTRVRACATVHAAADLKCLAFDCESLRLLTHANAALERRLSVTPTANLATKLIRNNETLWCV